MDASIASMATYTAQLKDPMLLSTLIVESNYRVAVMAKRLGVSPSHLNSIVWRMWRQTPRQVINMHRVKRARELLLREDLISKAALKIGFEDAHHFCRWFKRQTGTCPSQFVAEQASGRNLARGRGAAKSHAKMASTKS